MLRTQDLLVGLVLARAQAAPGKKRRCGENVMRAAVEWPTLSSLSSGNSALRCCFRRPPVAS
jgi:hypothetical protein